MTGAAWALAVPGVVLAHGAAHGDPDAASGLPGGAALLVVGAVTVIVAARAEVSARLRTRGPAGRRPRPRTRASR